MICDNLSVKHGDFPVHYVSQRAIRFDSQLAVVKIPPNSGCQDFNPQMYVSFSDKFGRVWVKLIPEMESPI